MSEASHEGKSWNRWDKDTKKEYFLDKIGSWVNGKESRFENPTIKEGIEKEELELHVGNQVAKAFMQTSCVGFKSGSGQFMRTSPSYPG